MTRFCALAALALCPVCVSAADITTKVVLFAANQTTNPLILVWPYDVYHVIADNSANTGRVTSLELSIPGTGFIQAGGVGIKPGAARPMVFGFVAPDSFFVVPEAISAADILVAPGTAVDTASGIATAFTVSGSPTLIPGGGSSIIATLSVQTGSPAPVLPALLGRAVIEGAFVNVVGIPEPSTVLLAGLAAAGFVVRRG